MLNFKSGMILRKNWQNNAKQNWTNQTKNSKITGNKTEAKTWLNSFLGKNFNKLDGIRTNMSKKIKLSNVKNKKQATVRIMGEIKVNKTSYFFNGEWIDPAQ